nr:immunoglobulin heavy chain junction region [Macaca mulatta]MOX62993.1 immunoglobulin heavy chain junction region [Macaca mulatta]MOX65230.1 immunoglobulin heavy chain junction region [Macaca mulatta]MOX65677.1 immunoglobulin heavy chain junction region [Macaca mulatta]MOX66400.1 immunoglobulin heavy chain junction region [Macaca mulatta]
CVRDSSGSGFDRW